MPDLDETHDPARRSWVASANDAATDFPIQNLPFGVFSPPGEAPRGGVAIGDTILDIGRAFEAGLLEGDAAEAASAPALNALLALGRGEARDLRRQVGALLDAENPPRPDLLHQAADCALHLPVTVRNYTDFYAGIHHAIAATSIMRPGTPPLPPNYKYVPIAYHGRASSVRPSGGDVRRPQGQRCPDPAQPPTFGPSERLDLELEMGVFVGAGNPVGEPIPIGEAAQHAWGFCLLNDWSARDIQAWEMAPLGPFLAKNFSTTISPWIVTADALAPFRAPAMARADADPKPLDYLWSDADQESGGLAVALAVSFRTQRMREAGEQAVTVIRSNARYLYWTPAQMLAHHSSGGCNMLPGDLIGTGTISGPTNDQLSSLLELTRAGQEPFTLPNGERRGFLHDGDEVSFTARCERPGYVPIGFGTCGGRVIP